MAEFAQLRLEEGLPELRQIERLKLMDKNEISRVVKRRKRYEYGIQRHLKAKEDYLKYIEYELNLLMLLRLRRQRLGNWNQHKTIEWPIAARIKRLFKQAVFRYPSNVKLWLSFIEFCHRMKWEETISELYAALLKVHNDKADLWISAARFEAEENTSMETARQLLLRALRFLPDSKTLHLEFFQMELNHAKFLREDFQKLIKTAKDAEALETDSVTSGRLAEVIYKNARKAIKGAEIVISFLQICQKFDFTLQLQDVIYSDLVEFRYDIDARATLSMRPLQQLNCRRENLTVATDEMQKAEIVCFQNFDDATRTLPVDRMWVAYIHFCLDRLRVDRPTESAEILRETLLNVFSRASRRSLLWPLFYLQWVQLIAERDLPKCCEILQIATKQFPYHARLWEERILKQLACGSSKSKISKMFVEACKSVTPEDSLPVWKLAVSWNVLHNPTEVKSVFESSLQMPANVAKIMKVQYLEHVALNDGIEAARLLYRRIWSMSPICLEFCLKMCDIEEAMPEPNMDLMRRVLDDACTNYGESDINLWIRYVNLERTYCTVQHDRGALIHSRAIRTLTPELVDQFITYYSLLMIQTTETGNV